MKKASLLLKGIQHDGRATNILVSDGRFSAIGCPADTPADEVMDCTRLAILPAFYNAHTHAAMTLLRGYADDMELFKWLTQYIWPYEGKLTSEDIRQGSMLAVLEMVKSGTVAFNDMYWNAEQTIDVVQRLGVRATIGLTFMDRLPSEEIERLFRFIENWSDPTGGRIPLAVAPHAIYTVSRDLFVRCADAARAAGVPLHFHLSETEQEVRDCVAAHGVTPVRLLHQWGVLGSNCVAAHVVHVDDEEISILADADVTVAHCPCSNMKLSSGIFRAEAMAAAGVRVALGTDGCSSNNNLSMLEEAKFASLLAKAHFGPEALPVQRVQQWATRHGAEALGINAGTIAEGVCADAILVNLDNERLLPCHNLSSNWIYSADTRSIHSVLCDGRFVLRNGKMEGEDDIIADFKRHIAAKSQK